jgi:hypothetical protein
METKEAIVVKENELVTILKDSQLDETKSQFILRNFQGYFALAAEWEVKARSIVVTRADQTAEIEMARVGRLFLRQKRLMIEGARKELKEQALREGKTIDNISNTLKGLIIPIETYLESQERFVEIQEEKKREVMRLEIEARIEAERVAKEKADMEEQVRVRAENERLKQEAAVREKQALAERAEAEKVLAAERAKAEEIRAREWERTEAVRKNHEKKLAIEKAKAKEAADEAAEELKAIEYKARAEREKQEKTLANERARDKRLKEIAEEKAQAKLAAERKEKERLAEILKNQITCPECGHKFQLKGK